MATIFLGIQTRLGVSKFITSAKRGHGVMEIAPEFEIPGHRWRVELIMKVQDVFGARESRSCPIRTCIPFSSLWSLHFHWKPSCLLIGVLQDNLAS